MVSKISGLISHCSTVQPILIPTLIMISVHGWGFSLIFWKYQLNLTDKWQRSPRKVFKSDNHIRQSLSKWLNQKLTTLGNPQNIFILVWVQPDSSCRVSYWRGINLKRRGAALGLPYTGLSRVNGQKQNGKNWPMHHTGREVYSLEVFWNMNR